MMKKKGRKNKRNRKRKNGMYLGNLKSITSTTFSQQITGVSCCRVPVFGLGPKVNGIYAQWTQYNEFVESGSKS